MTQKRKTILYWGLAWGTFMTVGMTAFNAIENQNWGAFLSWKIIPKFIIFTLLGFGIGWFNWKGQHKP